MKAACEQLEAILERQIPAELAALEEHARNCAPCALQLKLDREISAAAPALQKAWDSPNLWPRIAGALEAETEKKHTRILAFPATRMAQWRLAAAAAVLLMVTVASVRIIMTQRSGGPENPQVGHANLDDNQRLLTEQALQDVEKSEAAYVKSINQLAAVAAPRMQHHDSALLSNYREKLLLLDTAIAELRAQADGNRFNAALRKELLQMYQTKQQTLQELMKEEVR